MGHRESPSLRPTLNQRHNPPLRHTRTRPPRSGFVQVGFCLSWPDQPTNVFAGDTVDWVFDGGHVASRFISVKPKVANTTTDETGISNAIIDPTLYERNRSSVTYARFLLVEGTLQNVDKVIHIRAGHIEELNVTAAPTQSHDFH